MVSNCLGCRGGDKKTSIGLDRSRSEQDSCGTLNDGGWMNVPEDRIVNDVGGRSSLMLGEIVEALDYSYHYFTEYLYYKSYCQHR